MNTAIDREKYSRILSRIESPGSVRELSKTELENLCWACRQRIIDATSLAGGHLSSSLGTVELTVALYHVFNGEKDHFIWDVGHQAYTHKILTGRSEGIGRIGTRSGVAKFLKRSESPYDHFGAGHASTSISAAVGMAIAKQYTGEAYEVIPIIGDGALTGGMAYEAMNQAGDLGLNIKIILNDNEMSIDPNVGALSKAFNIIQSNQFYNKVREEVQELGENNGKIPKMIYKSLKRFDHSFMEFLSPASWFEKLGFRYFGPIDGHNLPALLKALQAAKSISEPLLLHIITKKGKGYTYAENDSLGYHGVTPFEPGSGKFLKASGGVSYTSVWSAAMKELLETDNKTVAVSAAMIASTGLKNLQQQYPERVFDVGIAEQHAVTFAAGLSTKGVKPFVAIYSTFLQRAFDQVIHDVCIQNLPVRFVLDRAGLVGNDGETHHGAFDLSYLRMIPNMSIMAPKDGRELSRMIKTMHNYDQGPCAIRFPRGNAAVFPQPGEAVDAVPFGKAEVMTEGSDFLVIAVGSMVEAAQRVLVQPCFADFAVGLINARFIKPLDEALLLEKIRPVKGVITIEENVIRGGFGSAVTEMMQAADVYKPVKQLGLPDQFVLYGSVQDQLQDAGLDDESLQHAFETFFAKLS